MVAIDIIIPVYNASETIKKLIHRLNEWAASGAPTFRVIFVDDSSTDSTKNLLIAEPKSFEYKLIQLATNYGQHTATAIGIGMSSAPLIATIDDDLQHDPFEINQLIETLHSENADFVYGQYVQKRHSIVRNLGSLLLKKILFLFDIDFNSTTSFRLMKSRLAKQFKESNSSVVFIDAYFKKYASKMTTCQVNHFDPCGGNSRYTLWKLLKFSLKIIFYHSSIPLKFITRFGLFMALLFLVSGCYFIYKKMFYNVPLGYTSLIVAIFFSTGMIMLSLGIIGEYIRKIWISQNKLDQISFHDASE